MTAYTFPLLDNTSRNNYLINHKIIKCPEHLIKKVSQYMHVSITDMKSECRKREFAEARQIAMYLIRKHTNLPLKNIGEIFMNRDHATVINAIKVVNNLTDTDKQFRERLQGIMEII